MVTPDEPGAAYLEPDDRVIGFELDGVAVAVPLAIGWIHEIVNLEVGTHQISVTYCPLTGSGLVFDRSAVDGAEFGVSGLLYNTNLILYDRTNDETLWSQMGRRGICGPEAGKRLDMLPAVEMRWDGWRALHSGTLVPAHLPEEDQRFGFYSYPYGDYEEPDNAALLFPVPFIDPRRPPKERVLGIPLGATGGIAFPYGALDEGGSVNAVTSAVSGREIVVFWDREYEMAVAFLPTVDAVGRLTFEVRNGEITDGETGSIWSLDGRATAGVLAGERLRPVAEAYVAFWFAWAAFHPDTQLWGGGRPLRASWASARRSHPARVAAGALCLLLLGAGAEPLSGQWLDVTTFHHDTRRWFDREGSTERIPNGGHAVNTSVFITAAVGIVQGVDGWVELPLHHLRYDDHTAERRRTGLGDPRIFLRVGSELLRLPRVPLALRGGVKLPYGDFDLDAEVIPLGEGQRDIELFLEVGHSFYPHPIWVMAWVGRRWRAPNHTTQRTPGDERVWFAAAGGELGSGVVGWRLTLEGMSGDPWIIEEIRLPTSRRSLTQGFASLDVPAGPGRVGAGVRYPFRGRNLAAGPALVFRYFLSWQR